MNTRCFSIFFSLSNYWQRFLLDSFDFLQNFFKLVEEDVGVIRLENQSWPYAEWHIATSSGLDAFLEKFEILF